MIWCRFPVFCFSLWGWYNIDFCVLRVVWFECGFPEFWFAGWVVLCFGALRWRVFGFGGCVVILWVWWLRGGRFSGGLWCFRCWLLI